MSNEMNPKLKHMNAIIKPNVNDWHAANHKRFSPSTIRNIAVRRDWLNSAHYHKIAASRGRKIEHVHFVEMTQAQHRRSTDAA
jgi:hypothetical protein